MTVTREELAAKAAEDVAREHERVMQADETARRREEAKEKTRKRRSDSIDKDETELKILTDLKAGLLAKLRKPDNDGVVRPRLRKVRRALNNDFINATRTGALGPDNPLLMELRIHVLLLWCYQKRQSKYVAVRQLLKDYGARNVPGTIQRYATDEERAYNPYGLKSITFGNVLQNLRLRGIGVREIFSDDHIVKHEDRLTLVCLKGVGHADWKVRIDSYISKQKTRCMRCAQAQRWIRKG